MMHAEGLRVVPDLWGCSHVAADLWSRHGEVLFRAVVQDGAAVPHVGEVIDCLMGDERPDRGWWHIVATVVGVEYEAATYPDVVHVTARLEASVVSVTEDMDAFVVRRRIRQLRALDGVR